MDKKTLTALERSIARWDELAQAEETRWLDLSAADCALCQLFWARAPKGCGQCPVAIQTGRTACFGSPFYLASASLEDWKEDPENDELRDHFRQSARAEAEFLRSLLPEV